MLFLLKLLLVGVTSSHAFWLRMSAGR